MGILVDLKEAVVVEVAIVYAVVDALVAGNVRSAHITATTIILSIIVGIFIANPLRPIKPSPKMIPPQHLLPLPSPPQFRRPK